MRVELEVNPAVHTPHARISAPQLDDELDHAVQTLAAIGDEHGIIKTLAASDTLLGYVHGCTIPMQLREVYAVRMDDGHVQLVTARGVMRTTGRLYEVERKLTSDFVRISKSAIVNMRAIDHVKAGFGGQVGVKLKDGTVEWVSRRCLRAFKRALGM